MSMGEMVLMLGSGLGLLVAGAEWLVRGSVGLALRWGVTPLAVGLTVVAFGTSAPELAVSLRAAWVGQGDIAAGNVVGSNISNIALILGLAALARPIAVQCRVLRREIPVMIGVALLLPAILWDGEVSRLEGAGLSLGIIGYVVVVYVLARKETGPDPAGDLPGAGRVARRHPLSLAGVVLAGLAGLIAGAHLFVSGAVGLAEQLGFSQAVIGLTVVAVGTSLPELVTSLVAAWRGQGDIALGNIIGSNVFNVLGILGPAALIAPFSATGVGMHDVWVLVGCSLVMWPLARTGHRFSRVEGGMLLVAYGLYIGILFR